MSNTVRASVVGTENAGDILSFPSLRVKDIDLTKFVRDGLDVLDNWSVARDNPSIASVNARWLHPMHTDCGKSKINGKKPVEPTCQLCEKTLRASVGIGKNVEFFNRDKRYGMVLFNHRNVEVFVCRNCVQTETFRDDILKVIPETWRGLVAADGVDVFGLVATMYEDMDNYAPHTINFEPHNNYKKEIVIENANGSKTRKKVVQRLDWPRATQLLIDTETKEKEATRKAKAIAKAAKEKERKEKAKAKLQSK